MKHKCRTILLLILLILLSLTVGCRSESEGEQTDAARIARMMQGYRTAPEETRSALASIDTVLLGEPAYKIIDEQSNGYGTGIYSILTYAYRRGDSDSVCLGFTVTAERGELAPGQFDFVGIEWDRDAASYELSAGDRKRTSVHAVARSSLVVFYLEEDGFGRNAYAYGSVTVMPTGDRDIAFGAKLVHDYTVWGFEGQSELVFHEGSKALLTDAVYPYGFSVTTGVQSAAWEIRADTYAELS